MPAPWLADPWLVSLRKRNKVACVWHHQCLKTHPLCSADPQVAGWAIVSHLRIGAESPSKHSSGATMQHVNNPPHLQGVLVRQQGGLGSHGVPQTYIPGSLPMLFVVLLQPGYEGMPEPDC